MRTVLALLLSSLTSGCSMIIPRLLPLDDLPPPTGDYGVGTQTLEWLDESRDEWFTPDKDDKRRLAIQVWYPTDATELLPAPYLDQPDLRLSPLAKQMGLPRFLIEHLQQVMSHSIPDAPPVTDPAPRPLLLFSHGLGGMKTQNMIQIEELVSQGYIVVALDHAYDAYLTLFRDGSQADYRSGHDGELTTEQFWALRTPQLATRTADMIFLLNEISQRADKGEMPWSLVDLNRIGIFGHSYGGATSIMAAATDSRIKASLALDGWMVPIPEVQISTGFSRPFLYIGQAAWDDPLNYEKLDRMLANSQVTAAKQLIEGTKHFDFSDTPQLSPFARRLGLAGAVPRETLRQRLNDEITQFFNTHVRDLPLAD